LGKKSAKSLITMKFNSTDKDKSLADSKALDGNPLQAERSICIYLFLPVMGFLYIDFLTSKYGKSFSVPQLIIGILIGGILFGLPMVLCIVLYKFFDRTCH